MSDDERKTFWFPAKKYGIGWSLPNCWQGWAVFGVYFAVAISVAPWIFRHSGMAIGELFVFSWTALLVLVVAMKGEPMK